MVFNILNKGFSRPDGVSLKNRLFVTFFGIGFIPFASGTFATFISYIFIVILTTLLAKILPPFLFWVVFLALQGGLYFLAVKSINTYLSLTGRKDPHEIVIDEVIGTFATVTTSLLLLMVLSQIPPLATEGYSSFATTWHFHLISLLLFRLLDILKPGPIGVADKNNTGHGVVNDDLLAGIFAGIITNILYALAVFIF